LATAVLVAALSTAPRALQPEPPLPAALARAVDPVVNAIWARFDTRAAMADVRFASRFWRLAGNPGFDATIDRLHAELVRAGFSSARASAAGRRPSAWIESYPNSGHGWSYAVGTLALARDGQSDEVLLSHDTHPLAVCINSFSTPPGGVVARIVDVGRGEADADYANKPIAGAVVLGDADPETLWRFAVNARGAAGVISTDLDEFITPDAPGAPASPRQTWNILQWGSVPYDAGHRAFGFKATPRAAARLRDDLRRSGGRTRVRVDVRSQFSGKPSRTLVAEIPGRTLPQERIVLAAHVQEPGANDNASGLSTLVELARALRSAIASGAVRPPDRTLTFLWLDEIDGSRQWLKDHASEAARVKHMMSLDMVGEDVARTGGAFLVERWPDPGAVWERPWDPHTAWGRGNVRVERLRGDLLNDLHLAVCRHVARRSGWIVKSNPYEGGSDHTVFGEAGIPSLLNWHFTDRFYHSNLDTPDKVSPAEMRNVASAVGASAWLLASTDETRALSIAELVAQAGRARIAVEERQGAAVPAGNPRMGRLRQAEIVATWHKWYAEAVRSAARLTLSPSGDFLRKLDALARPFEN
jgi:hypothetical protein